MRFPMGKGYVDNNVIRVDVRHHISALQDVDIVQRIVLQERMSHGCDALPAHPTLVACRAGADHRQRLRRSRDVSRLHAPKYWDGVFGVNDKNDGES